MTPVLYYPCFAVNVSCYPGRALSIPGWIPCKVHGEGAPRNLCGTPK